MKKLFTLLLSLMMILTLTACGSKEETPVAGANHYFDGDFEDPHDDFKTTESLSLNDDIPTEFNEIPDLANMPVEETRSEEKAESP